MYIRFMCIPVYIYRKTLVFGGSYHIDIYIIYNTHIYIYITYIYMYILYMYIYIIHVYIFYIYIYIYMYTHLLRKSFSGCFTGGRGMIKMRNTSLFFEIYRLIVWTPFCHKNWVAVFEGWVPIL